MKKLLAFFLLFSLALISHASTTNYLRYSMSGGVFKTNSPAATCSAYASGTGSGNYTGHLVVTSANASGWSCQLVRNDNGQDQGLPAGIFVDTITCTDPQVLNGSGVCSDPPQVTCPAGNKRQYAITSENLPETVCQSQCSWSQSGQTAVAVNGVWYSQYTSSSSNCTGGDTPGVAPDPGVCPKGTHDISTDKNSINCTADKPAAPQCWAGTVNVSTDPTIAICVGEQLPTPTPVEGAPEKTTSTVTEKNPDGSTTTTETTTTTTTNTDGSKSTSTTQTQTTVNADGTTTTKVVVGGSGGKGESEYSGGCNQGAVAAVCNGDAIQCEIVKQASELNCRAKKDRDDLAAMGITTLGNQVLSGNDPAAGTLPTKENATQINMQSLDQSGFLGGGACFQDKVFTVQGRSITLPFSKVCPYLEWLRYVIMLIAALVSFRIISKPVLGD